MRWTSSVLNLSVAPMLKLTGGLLSCPLRHGGDRLHGSRWWLLTHRCCRFGSDSSRSRRLLFREALLEGFHQINHGSHMWLGHFGHFLPLELGTAHRLHLLLLIVSVFLWLERSRETPHVTVTQLSFFSFSF